MSDFVNKIKTKDGQEYDIHDKRVDTFNKVIADDGSLLVDEVVSPTPVANFDGVDYFHKQEFDLLSLINEPRNTKWSILTGEETTEYFSFLDRNYAGGGPNTWEMINLALHSGLKFTIKIADEGTLTPAPTVNYTSRSFTVVQQMSEVTDHTKICLPGCTAYYGFLSEDGKTFISYWNEEGDGVKPITKISDAEGNEADIHDARLNVTAADIGKVVGVNDNGELTLVNAPSGGTKLYLHHFTGFTIYQSSDLYIVSFDAQPCSGFQDIGNLMSASIKIYVQGGGASSPADFDSYDYWVSGPGAGNTGHLELYTNTGIKEVLDTQGQSFYTFNTTSVSSDFTDFTDTVTEL